MRKFLLASVFVAAAAITAMAQTPPPSNSVTLNWVVPSAYQSGQILTVGQVNVYYDSTETSQSGPAVTLTTPALLPGAHTFHVVACDNMIPTNCSPMSTPVTVTIPAVTLVVPTVSNLTAKVNP